MSSPVYRDKLTSPSHTKQNRNIMMQLKYVCPDYYCTFNLIQYLIKCVHEQNNKIIPEFKRANSCASQKRREEKVIAWTDDDHLVELLAHVLQHR